MVAVLVELDLDWDPFLVVPLWVEPADLLPPLELCLPVDLLPLLAVLVDCFFLLLCFLLVEAVVRVLLLLLLLEFELDEADLAAPVWVELLDFRL